MKILLTGAAGFIGAHVAEKLLMEGNEVIGIDCVNAYYDPSLKFARLSRLGISSESEQWSKPILSDKWPLFTFIRMDISDKEAMKAIFEEGKFDVVVHLAAQPGVRYSITHPQSYIENNINGFLNILEGCRKTNIKHLVFASSSSVYGLNGQIPFSEKHSIAHPVSLYAATKKSNELMAHAYSYIFRIPITGLRFFTVYGPWGRPDMSPFLFIDGIMNGKTIKVFNNGDMLRDFTYIDDITESIARIVKVIPTSNNNWDSMAADPSCSSAPYKIYNVGNQQPTKLLDYISAIEEIIGKKAIKEMHPMQPGDVYQTYADSSALAQATGFRPSVSLRDGIKKTVEWFKAYYNL
ncbi:MAG: NAD-dependent epimerase [Muribaculaceae bacterium]|nr:NAD-dependent epimerase [Muribaculaceae bacterium]